MTQTNAGLILVALMAAAGVACDEPTKPTAEVDAPSAAPSGPASPPPTATASAEKQEAGESRHEVAGYGVTIPNAWKRTTDKPTEKRFEDPGGKGAMPPTCSLEEREVKVDQEVFDLEEADNPTVTDHEKKSVKVGDRPGMDHQFVVEPPGGSPMRVWVRIVDLGGGKRLLLQCLADASHFEALKESSFTAVFESLKQGKG